MGLDVGDRRIGLAVSIPPGALILPAGHLERTTLRVDAARILAAAVERNAVAIIVGMPYNTRGQAGEQARKTTTLIRVLERLTEVPIITVDERYTSVRRRRRFDRFGSQSQPGTRSRGRRGRRCHPAPFSGKRLTDSGSTC